MASNYSQQNNKLTSIALTIDNVSKKMTNSEKFFTLSDYSYTDMSNDEYCYTEDGYNGGTWGLPLQTDYAKQNINLPFVDVLTAPNFYMYEKNNTCYKLFPTNNITTTYKRVLVKCIPLYGNVQKTINLSHNGTSLVISNDGNTTEINTSPYILIDIQAPGGNGGSGFAGVYQENLFTKSMVLAGGGGGGSGAYISLSSNLQNAAINIVKNEYGICSIRTSDNANQYLSLEPGYHGTKVQVTVDNNYIYEVPTINDYDTTNYSRGGRVILIDEINPGNIQTQLPPNISFSSSTWIIYAIPGAQGGAGKGIRFVNNSDTKKYDGTTSESLTTNSVYLSSLTSSLTECHYNKNGQSNIAGNGELASVSEATWFIGGGGGAPSLMAKGGTHGGSGSGIGAGGFGGSAWASDINKDTVSSGDGSSGGQGMVWIYYLSHEILCDAKDGGHTYNETKIEPTCTSEGRREIICARCGKTETQTIPALGHTWDDGTLVEEPTCTDEGSELYVCTVCNEGTKIESIPAQGHSFYKDAPYNHYYYQKCHNCDYEEELGYQIYIDGKESDNYIKENETLTLTVWYTVPEAVIKDVTVQYATKESYNNQTGELKISNPTGTVYINRIF